MDVLAGVDNRRGCGGWFHRINRRVDRRVGGGVEEEEPRARALRQLVEVHAKAGRLDQALQVSASIEIGGIRLEALLDIAKAQAELGHQEAARRAFRAARDLSVELVAQSKSVKEFGLFLCVSRAMIAAAQVEAGYGDDAFHTAESGDRACERALGFFAIAQVVSGEGFLG